MRVLVACEFSGIVRDAFAARGHESWSVDLLPCERRGNHIIGDAFCMIDRSWDLMIAHPPCTYLSNSGVCHLGTEVDRWKKMIDGAVFFRKLLHSKIKKVCIENPVMHGYAKAIIGAVQTQLIQPWMFGHPESKATCLWLRGLPPLVETRNVKAEMLALPKNQRERLHYLAPGPERWRERSRTFQGIADAMAEQWGKV